ncbi:MAG TPA: alpha/beta hydrolase [Chloroflexota bacterium]|nr:alpha/beta hydrolase [Chloroflexota bacterium]
MAEQRAEDHQSGIDHEITVNGVNLHYLDWGGQGPVLLFLTGLGNTAYIYDDLAPRFTDRFRVLGLTRRGHGRSDTTETGYDTGTLTEDVRAFLDALGIERASFVGHSLAGDELTRFVTLYPERVDRLVYLDAAYDRSGMPDMMASLPVPLPEEGDQEWESWESAEAAVRRFYPAWTDAVARELRELCVVGEDGRIRSRMSGTVEKALMTGTVASAPDFGRIVVPALSFYAYPADFSQAWGELDPEDRAAVQRWTDEIFLPYTRENVERFRREVPLGRVVEMTESHHYCFLDRPEAVYEEMRDFLLASA